MGNHAPVCISWRKWILVLFVVGAVALIVHPVCAADDHLINIYAVLGTDVYIDGQYSCTTTNNPTVVRVTMGSHSFRFSKTGYYEYTTTSDQILVNGGQYQVPLTPTPTPTPRPGILTIDSNPTGADIAVDGEYIGEMTPETISLAPGSHKIEIGKLKYSVYRKEITIASGVSYTIHADLMPPLTEPTRSSRPTYVIPQQNMSSSPNMTYLWSYPTGDVVAVAISADRQYIAVGSGDGKVYSLSSDGKQLWNYSIGDNVVAVAISADGQYIVVGSGDHNVYFLNREGQLLWSYPTGNLVAVSADGQYVAVAGDKVNYYTRHGQLRWSFSTNDEISNVAISADGQYVVIGAKEYREKYQSRDYKVYSLSSDGQLLWSYSTDVLALAISADGQYVAVGSNEGKVFSFSRDGQLLWNYSTRNYIPSVAVSADGQYVVAGSGNGDLYYFSRDGKQLWNYSWNYSTRNYIPSVAMSADGQYVVAGSGNGDLYYFSRDGKQLWNYSTGYQIPRVAVSADGQYVVAGYDKVYFLSRNDSSSEISPINSKLSQNSVPGISVNSSPSNPTFSTTNLFPPGAFNPLALLSIILVFCIGCGGYYVLTTRKPSGKLSPEMRANPQKPPVPVGIPHLPSPESLPPDRSPALHELIKTAEKNTTTLTHFRAPVDSLLALSRQFSGSSNYHAAEHIVKKTELLTESLRQRESQLSQWKIQGYDTGSLETLKTDDAAEIFSKFKTYEQGIEQLEKVGLSLEAVKKEYPAIVTRNGFTDLVSAVEQYLKKPDLSANAESELERLKVRIQEYIQEQGRLKVHLQSQLETVSRAVTDTSVLDEMNHIRNLIQQDHLTEGNHLFQELAARQVTQVNDSIASLRNEGAVIPEFIRPIQLKANDTGYGDVLLETSRITGELARFKQQFADATTIKKTVSDPGLLELYDEGKYEDFIGENKKQEISRHLSSTSEKVQDLVFISSKSADYQYVLKLYDFLVSNDKNVFFSQESLPMMGNADYREEIDKAIDQAKHMIVVGSSVENILSPWVKDEWGAFVIEKRSGRKPGSNLITMTIGSVKIDELPISLRMNEVIPFDPEKFSAILNYLS